MRKKPLVMLLAAICAVGLMFSACTPAESSSQASSTASATSSTASTPDVADVAAFNESPMLKARVDSGELPPVEERLPIEPLVIVPRDGVGTYGGEMKTRLSGPGDWGDIWHATFPHLFWFNEEANEIVPELAKDYKFNDDYTVLTIYLREGLKWSDGEPFTTEDILCWWNDYRMNKEFNPDLVPPGDWAPGGEAMKLNKIDNYTIELQFAAPYKAALTVLTSFNGMQGRFFLPSHLVRKYHLEHNPDAEKIMGEMGEDVETWQGAVAKWANLMWPGGDAKYVLPTLGMWRQKEMTTTQITFERNPYYYAVDTEGNQLPYIDTVRAEIVEDNEVAKINAMQGKYDYGKVAVTDLELMKSNEGTADFSILLYDGEVVSSTAFAFNQTSKDPIKAEIFQDVRFRQAMSLAINREEFNDLINDGYGTIGSATVHKSATFYEDRWSEVYTEYDVDRANALLDEMGLDQKDANGFRKAKDGKVFTVIIPTTGPATELVRDYWNAVGVKTELTNMDSSLYSTRSADWDLDMGVWGIDNTVEFKVFQNTSKFWIGNQDVAYGVAWGKWIDTNGKEGVEPPEKVKKYVENWKAIQIASGDEYTRLAKEIFNFFADELYIIGTSGYLPSPVYVSNKLGNVAQSALFMDPTNWWLLQRPDTWFFK